MKTCTGSPKKHLLYIGPLFVMKVSGNVGVLFFLLSVFRFAVSNIFVAFAHDLVRS
jgi:hypothetical protein